MTMEYPVRVVICGMGSRGKDTYAPISEIMPDSMQITAIAEPIEEKREYCRRRYGLPENMCFETGEEMFAGEKLGILPSSVRRMRSTWAMPWRR